MTERATPEPPSLTLLLREALADGAGPVEILQLFHSSGFPEATMADAEQVCASWPASQANLRRVAELAEYLDGDPERLEKLNRGEWPDAPPNKSRDD